MRGLGTGEPTIPGCPVVRDCAQFQESLFRRDRFILWYVEHLF